jgi:hypothetical protein
MGDEASSLFLPCTCSAEPVRSPAGRSRSCFFLLRRCRRKHPAGSRRVFQLEAVIHRYAEGVLGELMVSSQTSICLSVLQYTVALRWTPGRFASGSSHLDFWHVLTGIVACSLPGSMHRPASPACFTHNTTAATTSLFYSQHCPYFNFLSN